MEKRQIPNFPGYKIDRKGQVWGPSGKKLKPFMDRSGAMRVNLVSPNHRHRVTKYPQRLVCEAFHTTKFEHKNVSVRDHKCRSKRINHADRFKWGTQKQVKRRGVSNTLTPEQRQEIMQLYQRGDVTQHQLAKMFGVTQPNISFIIKNRGGTKRQHLLQKTIIKVLKMLDQKVGAKDIAKQLGIGFSTVYRIKKRWKL